MRSALLFLILGAFLTGCDEDQDPQVWAAQVAEKRAVALKSMVQSELRYDDHVAIKQYFSEIADAAIAIKRKPNRAKELLKNAGYASVDAVCSNLLVTRAEWQELMARCQYRGFFVCAEEVRAYPDAIQTIVVRLDSDSRALFFASSACPLF